MENNMFSLQTDMACRNSMVIDGISSNMTSDSLVQSHSFDLNNQDQIMAGFPMFSTLPGEPTNLHAELPLTNHAGICDSDGTLLGRNAIGNVSIGSSHPMNNSEFQEQFMRGTPISAASLAALLATRSDIHENLNDLTISVPTILASEVLKAYDPNECSNASNHSFATSPDCGYDETHGNINSKWEFDKCLPPLELAGKIQVRTGFQPLQFMGHLDPNRWISENNANVGTDHPYGSSKFSNELSLSLATSQPSVICGATIPDQCSEISCSGAAHGCLNETGMGSEQNSCNSKELSLSFASYRPVQLSQVLSGSRYLRVVQEILAEIASYSLDNLDHMFYSTSGMCSGASLSSNLSAERGESVIGSDEFHDGDGRFEVQMEPTLPRREVEAKKTQLLALLQVVDDQYNRCLDEIHTVISAFHAATELDPQIHTRFALHTISFLYKSLRERISNQILSLGAHFSNGDMGEKERCFESSFVQKQWAIQQLKRKDHQLWRPQRGLPERSVSVLRAWMFENFLHPYPKDAEKHILAVKSGLTRSQVSNWFINARVRLWKPMIEEMYSELNRRKARQGEEGTNCNRNHISIDQRFKMS